MPAIFAAAPVYSALHHTDKFKPDIFAIIFMVVFTVFMLSLALLLLYYAFRNVEMIADDNGDLKRLTRIFCFESSRHLEFDTIRLGSYWYGQTFRVEIHTVTGIRSDNEIQIASDHDANDVFGLFDWLRENTRIECIDERRATPV